MKNLRIRVLCILGIFLLTISMSAQTSWKLDSSHSSISFSVDHLVVSETVGQFNDYSSKITANKLDFTDAKFDIVIQVKSIDTKDEKRDEHLKSSDFFDADKYPTISFKGEKFEKILGNEYKISGIITIHGVTKKVTFNAKFGGIVKDPWGGIRAGLKLWGEIDRYDYNLKYNSVLETGGLAIGRKVKIECRAELIKE